MIDANKPGNPRVHSLATRISMRLSNRIRTFLKDEDIELFRQEAYAVIREEIEDDRKSNGRTA